MKTTHDTFFLQARIEELEEALNFVYGETFLKDIQQFNGIQSIRSLNNYEKLNDYYNILRGAFYAAHQTKLKR